MALQLLASLETCFGKIEQCLSSTRHGKVLTRERLLGLDLVKGVKREGEAATTPADPPPASVAPEKENPGREQEVAGAPEGQVTGLPLFDGDTP